jgi:hypothetical protein
MSFGISLSHDGRNATLQDDIDQAISIILFTMPGERIYDPEYGCELRNALDKPPYVLQQASVSVVEAINKYERRVEVLSVSIDTPSTAALAQGILRVSLIYKISVTGLIVSRAYQSDGSILRLTLSSR